MALAEVNRATQLHGLAVTGGVISSTGVAGLTLGGGLGWLMGKHGLALDNLLSIELVTAEGKVLRASQEDEPDLFWALRGGGGNFGVVTEFEVRLHPLTAVLLAEGLTPESGIRSLLEFWRDFMPGASHDLKWNIDLRLASHAERVPAGRKFSVHCVSMLTSRA